MQGRSRPVRDARDEIRTLLACTFDGEDVDSATVDPITTAAE